MDQNILKIDKSINTIKKEFEKIKADFNKTKAKELPISNKINRSKTKRFDLNERYKKGHSYVEITLNDTLKGYTFTASGMYGYEYNRSFKDWDFSGGGQCLDTILKLFPKNKELKEIYKLWKLYHLNDMKAGTPEQMKYLNSLGKYQSYDWACNELKKVNLLYDNNYRYGTGWLMEEIPKKDLNKIKKLIEW